MKKDSDKIFIPHYGAVDKRIAESYIQAMMKYTKLYCDIKQTSLDIYSAFCWPNKDKKTLEPIFERLDASGQIIQDVMVRQTLLLKRIAEESCNPK